MENKSKYNSLAEWSKADPNAYSAARRLKMIPEICNMFGWKNSKYSRRNTESDVLSKLGLDFNEYEKCKFEIINE
jgi:hypothetical protein